MNKTAVLSMDVEDWYHLYYFLDKADKSYSMLDGFTNYIDLLNKHDIKTTFFVLSELADSLKSELNYAVSCGHEIACHGKFHIRPLDLSITDFEKQLIDAKSKIENVIGKEVIGYRAPCYGIDNERHQLLHKIGFKYSSSKMNVPDHPLYGELDLTDFIEPIKGIYAKDGMTEFSLNTESLFGKHIAISGGGWIRLLPWSILMKPLIKKSIKSSYIYSLYIHPFELSKKQMPIVHGSGLITSIRARKGLGKVDIKIEQLIEILKDYNYCFDTYSNLISKYFI